MNFFGNGPEDEESRDDEPVDQFEQLEHMIDEEIENNYNSDSNDESSE
jgi:hypothetical protein